LDLDVEEAKMATLTADFKADLVALSRRHLSSDWGPAVQNIADEDIVLAFLDARRRRPAGRSRKLWVADDFSCPPQFASGWQALQTEVSQGADLWPRMSGRHMSLDNLDGLLNEWGVHHFHLGTASKADGSGLIERTGPVLFARVTENDFYAINVYHHGEWEKTSVLESLHRNWPDTIRQYRLNGIAGEPLTDTQRRNLRNVNVQAPTAVSDGTVYMAIGGGVVSSGASSRARMDADMMESDIEKLGPAVQDQLANFLDHLRANGYKDEPEIRATLTNITPHGYQVEFPSYGAGFNVTLIGGWYHRSRPS
jgi:hypothetical protein